MGKCGLLKKAFTDILNYVLSYYDKILCIKVLPSPIFENESKYKFCWKIYTF